MSQLSGARGRCKGRLPFQRLERSAREGVTFSATRNRDVDVLLGDPRKAIMAMFVPILLSLLIAQTNLLVDTAWCAGLGTGSLSAIGIVSSFYWLIIGMGNGMGIGASSAIARRIGAGDKVASDRLAAQAIALVVALASVVTPLLLTISTPLLTLVGASDTLPQCLSYITPYFLCSFFLMLNCVMSHLLRAEGAARRSMMVVTVSALLNMVLDPIYIYGLGWGIAGAAWATVTAATMSTMIAVFLFFIRRSTYLNISFQGFRPDRGLIGDIISVGLPEMIELNVMSLFNIILNFFIISCGGTEAMAYYNASWRLVSMSLIPATAIGGAILPVCAAAYGQKDLAKVRRGYNFSLRFAFIVLVTLSALMFLFAPYYSILFTYTGETEGMRPQMVDLLRIFCFFIPFYGWINIASALLQALRKAQWSMVSAMIRNVVLIAIYGITSIVSLEAMWWGLVAGEIFGGLLMGSWAWSSLRSEERRSLVMSRAINLDSGYMSADRDRT